MRYHCVWLTTRAVSWAVNPNLKAVFHLRVFHTHVYTHVKLYIRSGVTYEITKLINQQNLVFRPRFNVHLLIYLYFF